MKVSKIKVVTSFILLFLLSTMLNGAAQSDEYYSSYEVYYSADLKQGMEFTWEITKYSPPQTSNAGINPQQNASTTYYTTTTSGDYYNYTETTVTYVEETTYEESAIDFPDISVGTKLTVKLKRDLADFTDRSDLYNSEWNDEYFDVSVDRQNVTAITNFIPSFLLIQPSRLVFENGTEMNYFEYRYDITQQYTESIGEDVSQTVTIEDGVYSGRTNFNGTDGELGIYEDQIDIQTGLLLRIYVLDQVSNDKVEIEIKLVSTKGIDLKYLQGSGILELPFSAYFLYALVIASVIYRRKKYQ